ncbi:hypothetical protein IIC45_00955 [Patescibacteria group bacterium]|nr:hypothetical protein [Patescibacteria group bacterium]
MARDGNEDPNSEGIRAIRLGEALAALIAGDLSQEEHDAILATEGRLPYPESFTKKV